jgi:hypothetical protein
MKEIKFIWVFVTVSLITAISSFAQVASPLQSGHYAPAVMNIRDMAHPPSGLFIMWYNWHISTDTYIDKDGNEFNSINLDELHPALPNIDISLKAKGLGSIPCVFWASHFKLLGGARYMVGISPNYVYFDGSVFTETGGGIIDTTISSISEGSVSGFSDLFISPLGLTWGFEQVDFTFMYGIYAPTGRYETGSEE